jgi:hypothetical protein
MQMYPVIGGPVAALDWLRSLAGIVSTIQSEIIRLGLATAVEIDSSTLADRLYAEAAAADSVIVAPGMVGAWVRVQLLSRASSSSATRSAKGDRVCNRKAPE